MNKEIIIICLVIYILSVLAVRYAYRFAFRIGMFDSEEASGSVAWFLPIVNTLWILFVWFDIIQFSISEKTNNPLIKKFLNQDLEDKQLNE